MGQAAVDLPDPLDTPPPASASSTDDLLAQLAGEEIDRLLADAEGRSAREDTAAPTVPDPFGAEFADGFSPAPAPPSHYLQDVTDPAEREALLARSEATDVEAELAEVAPADRIEADLSRQLGAVLDEIEAGDGAQKVKAAPEASPFSTALSASEAPADAAMPDALLQVSEAAPIIVAASALAPPADAEEMPAEELSVDRETSTEEREGLSAAALQGEALVESRLAEEAEQLPIYLRPLEWLNAPLEACPEGVREAIGKIAVVTLFNAVAVLLYVVIFRRH